MTGILVVAEHRDGLVLGGTLEAVTAAAELGAVSVVVIGSDIAAISGQLQLEGVSEILQVGVPSAEFEADVWVEALQAVIAERQPRAVLAPWSVDAMGYGPAVAARAGLSLATDVYAVADAGGRLVATRASHGGKVEIEVAMGSGAPLLLLRAGAFAPAGPAGGAAVSDVAVEVRPSRARHLRYVAPPADGDVDITQARLLLAIGRGVGEQENLAQFEELAEQMGATLAVSRPLVDAGWASSARQVGQSGNVVKPAVYLAFGISGAIQHLAGMKESETVIAVNTDPEAAIFGIATFGAVADIFDIAEELEKLY